MSPKEFTSECIIKIHMTEKKQQLDPNAAFPAMLHRMLTDIDELSKRDGEMSKLKSIVSWLDHGKAFKIHDKKKFVSIIMPTWFIRLKYASFIRQLNTYNFIRIIDDGPDKGAIYHNKFVRGFPELTVDIEKGKRRRNHGAGGSSYKPLPADTAASQPVPAMAPASAQADMSSSSTTTTGRAFGTFAPMPFQQVFTKQFQSHDSLRTLMAATQARPAVMVFPQQMMQEQLPPPTCSFMPSVVSSLLCPEPTPFTHHRENHHHNRDPVVADDLFGGLTWVDTEEDHGCFSSSQHEDVFQHSASSGANHTYQDLDFEPVPISPHLDSQRFHQANPLQPIHTTTTHQFSARNNFFF